MTNVYIGFDYGKRYIGVAVGNDTTNHAEGIGVVLANKGVPTWDNIDVMLSKWRPKALIVGWPLNMDGSEQNLSKAVKVFERNLKERYKLDVYLVDERLTSYEAKKQLGKKEQDKTLVDSTSAKIVLEQWLLERNVNE